MRYVSGNTVLLTRFDNGQAVIDISVDGERVSTFKLSKKQLENLALDLTERCGQLS